MAVKPGTRLGPYEIVAALGAGGMGQVFRARDTRLDRQVAIKVLAHAFAGDESSRRRFQREAKAISALSHPHICTLFDVGEAVPEPSAEVAQAPVAYLVMELLDGGSLAQRLAAGPLPVPQVFEIGAQIAHALEAAHRQGIVHRDLKPANIVLTGSGAKLLDFGLAKAVAPEAPPEAATGAATDLMPLTERGTILGTFHYMAPEQLAGQEADRRSDLWALGCVLYEMASGQRPFQGETRAALMAAIVGAQPPALSELRPDLPPVVAHLISSCLEKAPADRWQSAHDLAVELDWAARSSQIAPSSPQAATVGRRREPLAWALAALLAAGLLASGWKAREASRRPPPPVVATVLAPEGATLEPALGISLSPDGTRVAFVAVDEQERRWLWIRPLAAAVAQPLNGTEGAFAPFWSPDGRHLGFFAEGRLKRVAAQGGPAQVIASAVQGRGGTWGPDGTILFTPGFDQPIFRVPVGGGTPVAVTRLDPQAGDQSHRWPSFLPDGRHFLYTVERRVMLQDQAENAADDASAIYLASLDGRVDRELVRTRVASAIFAQPSYLLYWKDDSLVAQPFDRRRLRLEGDLILVAPRLQRSIRWQSIVSAAANGTLVYHPGQGSGRSQLVFFDRSGRQLETMGPPLAYVQPRLSSDGTRIAVEVIDVATNINDLWVHEIERGTSTRLTATRARDSAPVWSPDDRRLAYSSSAASPSDIMVRASSGVGAAESLIADRHMTIPMDWSRDGERLFFHRVEESGRRWQIGYLSLASGEEAIVLESGEFLLLNPQVSPDGKWLLYESEEGGRSDVYLMPLGGETGKWQVSTSGGKYPRWRGDGREVYFVGDGSRLMAVAFEAGPKPVIGSPEPLFALSTVPHAGFQYDVAGDGQRFLVNAGLPETEPSSLTLVQGWTRTLER